MAQLDLWPSIVDSNGTPGTGTVINKTNVWDVQKSAIEDLVHSTANPTVKCKNIIDEVVAARGSKASLDARLDVGLEEDGTIKLPGSAVTTTQLRSQLGAVNLLSNDTFLIWPAGDTSLPADWVTASGSATYARSGSGISSPNDKQKAGLFALAITNAGKVEQQVIPAAQFTNSSAEIFKGTKFAFGCWVYATIASHARIYLDDGGTPTTSKYHSGTAGWEFISVKADLSQLVHQVSATATKLHFGLEVASAGTAWFSGPTLLYSDFAPNWHIPAPKAIGSLVFPFVGEPVLVNAEKRFRFGRPALIRSVSIDAESNAGTTAMIVDLDHWDGSAWQSIFSTRPQIVSAATADAAPDGTYRYRCFAAGHGTTIADARMRVIVDQATNSGGKHPVIRVLALQYMRPLEDFLAYNQ
jgi:hypothetical protein